MTLQRALRRLRLKPGDILIVRDPLLSTTQLVNAGRTAKLKFNVPIIYAYGKHDIEVKKP
jgi:hypothetical protein